MQPLILSPHVWSYRYGLFLGILTCAGFAIELVLKTGQEEEVGRRALVAVTALPFVAHSLSVLSGDLSRKLEVPRWISTPLVIGLLALGTLARELLGVFMIIVLVLVGILTTVALAKKALETIRSK